MKLRVASPGDRHVVLIVGGVISRPVPGYGVVVELEDEDIFLPAEMVFEVAQRLKETMKEGNA